MELSNKFKKSLLFSGVITAIFLIIYILYFNIICNLGPRFDCAFILILTPVPGALLIGSINTIFGTKISGVPLVVTSFIIWFWIFTGIVYLIMEFKK